MKKIDLIKELERFNDEAEVLIQTPYKYDDEIYLQVEKIEQDGSDAVILTFQ